ncbi:hypothetical protein C0J26_15200 [Pseudomonas baetica]|nr:hypothetical protein C0J26_15200 [Pseudomonas baetica]
MHSPCDDRSHAPRGNASRDAPRSGSEVDAERPRLHSHAERGNDRCGRAWPNQSATLMALTIAPNPAQRDYPSVVYGSPT